MFGNKHTVEFCGIKLVKWGSRPRLATKVLIRTCTLALTPDGSVACNWDSPFKRRPANEGPYLNADLAADLHALGVIDNATLKRHAAEFAARKAIRDGKDASWRIEKAADALGIKFTRDQRKTINAAALAKVSP
jgi:hypothetical protein